MDWFRKDIRPADLPELTWGPGAAEREASLRSVYGHATLIAQRAIDWYLKAKRHKKWPALGFRVVAIVGAAAASIVPMISQILGPGQAPWWAQPAMATVVLAVAGMLVLLDRFAGCSTAWMRFIWAEQNIRAALHQFQLDWERQRACWVEDQPTCKQAQEMLDRAKAFARQIDGIVLEDTKRWIAEFSATISQIDVMVKARQANGGGEEEAAGGATNAPPGTGTAETRGRQTDAAASGGQPARNDPGGT